MIKKIKMNIQSGLILGFAILLVISMQSKLAFSQTLTCPQPLIYGTFTITCPGASTVIIAPSGIRTVTGCLTTGGAPFSKASCSVAQGFPFKVIQISVLVDGVITRTTGAETMPVTTFNLVTDTNGSTYSTSLPFLNIPIGATLNVGSSPVSGDYQGSFTVNAIYQ